MKLKTTKLVYSPELGYFHRAPRLWIEILGAVSLLIVAWLVIIIL